MRVAIVHDWLVSWRGGEKVLEAIASLYPDAPIYTLFCDFSILPASLQQRKIVVHATANRFRLLRKATLPMLPIWIESFDLSQFDLVISTSSCVAKGVIVNPDAKHICYMHSPMRYIWDQRFEYLGSLRMIPGLRCLVDACSTWLRMWDVSSAQRVDQFIANSTFVRQRIMSFYRRPSVVIPPPIDTTRFSEQPPGPKSGYLLVAGAFVGYKRFDLAIQACERLGRRLIVAGQGPELKRLKALAGKNTEFQIAPDQKTWVQLMQGADALLFPGVEDFGMTAIEAMAAGTPVLAQRRGGALDFIEDGQTGLFFDVPSIESLQEVIHRSGAIQWDATKLRQHAMRFSYDNFLKRWAEVVSEHKK